MILCKETLKELKELGFDKAVMEDHDGGSVALIGCSKCDARYYDDIPVHETGCPNSKDTTVGSGSYEIKSLTKEQYKELLDAAMAWKRDEPPIIRKGSSSEQLWNLLDRIEKRNAAVYPNDNLASQLAIAKRISDSNDPHKDARRLANLVLKLHHCIIVGGSLPKRWADNIPACRAVQRILSEVMFPNGQMDKAWDADTLMEIADILQQEGFSGEDVRK